MTTTDAVKPDEVIDRLSTPAGSSSLAKADEPDVATMMQKLSDLGFIVPMATPEELRAAFAYRQQLYAAVLSPEDYLWVVSFQDVNKGRTAQRQWIAPDRDSAHERAKAIGGTVSARPKKDGIVKLAKALEITAVRIESKGLPDEPNATYASVTYKASHPRTGTEEIGIGYCDLTEGGGSKSKHDVIATADTRAYNRAVLRLSGFGTVSAEDIVGSPDAGAPGTEEAPESKGKPARERPPLTDDRVMAAAKSWALAIGGRVGTRWAAAAQQDTRSARETRAQARRGDQKGAAKLGALGLKWDGTASDGPGYETFLVEESPVQPEDVSAEEAPSNGATAVAAPAPTPEAPKQGWDLSSGASDDDPAFPKVTVSVPSPDPNAETITTKQAKTLSGLLIAAFSTKENARAWLGTHCHVERAVDLRTNQYAAVCAALQAASA